LDGLPATVRVDLIRLNFRIRLRQGFELRFRSRQHGIRNQETAAKRRTFAPILAMAAAQLKVPTGIWDFYAERDQTRREHLLELQEQFGYQAFTAAHYRRSALELDPSADQTHQGTRLAEALVESLRKAKNHYPGSTGPRAFVRGSD
jgi:hypothetical protein